MVPSIRKLAVESGISPLIPTFLGIGTQDISVTERSEQRYPSLNAVLSITRALAFIDVLSFSLISVGVSSTGPLPSASSLFNPYQAVFFQNRLFLIVKNQNQVELHVLFTRCYLVLFVQSKNQDLSLLE